jgi:hypothetical protein
MNTLPTTRNSSSLTEAWADHHKKPLDFDAINNLADLVNRKVTRVIPLDRFAGTPLVGQESAVRQDALQLLLTGGFLRGNKRLDEASRREDGERIEEEINRSIAAAIRYARMRLRRTLMSERRRFQLLPDDWPDESEQKHCHLEQAIVAAALVGKIRIRDQKMLHAIFLEGADPKRVARSFGLSKSQVYRRIKSVAKQLRYILKEVL